MNPSGLPSIISPRAFSFHTASAASWRAMGKQLQGAPPRAQADAPDVAPGEIRPLPKANRCQQDFAVGQCSRFLDGR